MQIATILGIPHLHLEQESRYHLCLAHLLGDERYRTFFSEKAQRGDIVIMDNGTVETGVPLAMENLIILAKWVGVTELILPDIIRNMGKTLKLGESAISCWYGEPAHLMAVPQGSTKLEWLSCLDEMLFYPIKTIGISKFVCNIFEDRFEALSSSKRLMNSEKAIHILGCNGDIREIKKIKEAFGDRIRGIDSGIANIYACAGMRMSDGEPKPQVELDFHRAVDEDLLKENIQYWKNVICSENG